MKKNMGSADRIVRMLLAALFILLFVFNIATGVLGYILLALAAIFILTSLVNWCPLYVPFGISTCAKKEKE
jgi:hypothetical protein